MPHWRGRWLPNIAILRAAPAVGTSFIVPPMEHADDQIRPLIICIPSLLELIHGHFSHDIARGK